MVTKIKLVRGDTRPQIKLTLTDEFTNVPVDLTDATVRMYFRAAGGTEILDTLLGAIADAATGQVIFTWKPTTLLVEPGDYEGEVEVTYQPGAIETVYDVLKFKVREDF